MHISINLIEFHLYSIKRVVYFITNALLSLERAPYSPYSLKRDLYSLKRAPYSLKKPYILSKESYFPSKEPYIPIFVYKLNRLSCTSWYSPALTQV